MSVKTCEICDRETEHDAGGICLEHKIVRRVEPAKPAVELVASAWQRPRTWIAIAAGIGLLVFASSAHFVHGAGVGWRLCWKKGWTLSDTFVNLDDYRRSDDIPVKVAWALDECMR